ncbi:MAG: rod shape-determining protein MreC [Anaplasmataceae bacterium]|nr:rod shape-determining protein MreC [Anaplasmataceae bacterium]
MNNRQYKFIDNTYLNNFKNTLKKYLPIASVIVYIIISLSLMFISVKKDFLIKYIHKEYSIIIEYILPTTSYIHKLKNSIIESITDLYIDIGKTLNIDIEKKTDNTYQELKKLSIATIVEENKQFKRALNFKEFNYKKYITTKVIFNIKNQINTVIYLEAGKKDGVLLDSAVISYNNILLGKIIEVNENYSKVMLLNDINFKIAAISEQTKKKIIIGGNGNHYNAIMKILFVDTNNSSHNLIEGEKIRTLDNFPNFPTNILIGSVYKDNIVKPSINFNDLYTVMIINTNNKSNNLK